MHHVEVADQDPARAVYKQITTIMYTVTTYIPERELVICHVLSVRDERTLTELHSEYSLRGQLPVNFGNLEKT